MKQPFSYAVASNLAAERSRSLHVLFAGESQTKPGHRLGPKVYDYYLMHHVLSGTGTFTDGETQYALRAGSTFLIEPERLISYASNEADPWQYRWIAFDGEEAARLLAGCGFDSLHPVSHVEANPRIGVLFHQVFQSLREGSAQADLLAIGYLHLLFAAYGNALSGMEARPLRTGGDGDTLVRQVTHYLSAQYAVPVSIEQMAESLGYNRAYLSRVFKQKTGMTPVAFLLRLRIDKARHLLRERPELTVEQIAHSVGMPDALYFSKQFKRFYAQAPSAYRHDMLFRDHT